MIQVLTGHRPPRPAGCADQLWGLIQKCWSEGLDDRPNARMILSVLRNPESIIEQQGVEMISVPVQGLGADTLLTLQRHPAPYEYQKGTLSNQSAMEHLLPPLSTLDCYEPERVAAMAKLTGGIDLVKPSTSNPFDAEVPESDEALALQRDGLEAMEALSLSTSRSVKDASNTGHARTEDDGNVATRAANVYNDDVGDEDDRPSKCSFVCLLLN
jgi:hypothetical protein